MSAQEAQSTDVFGGVSLAPTRVLVVDDHALFRRGLLILLAQETDIDVVGACDDATTAVELVVARGAELVLVDVQTPGGVVSLCRALKRAAPAVDIVVLAAQEDEAELYEAVKAGASGYRLKEVPVDEIAAAIRTAADGRAVLNPRMALRMLQEFSPPVAGPGLPGASRLTDLERKALALVASGPANRIDGRWLDTIGQTHLAEAVRAVQQHAKQEAELHAVRPGDTID